MGPVLTSSGFLHAKTARSDSQNSIGFGLVFGFVLFFWLTKQRQLHFLRQMLAILNKPGVWSSNSLSSRTSAERVGLGWVGLRCCIVDLFG